MSRKFEHVYFRTVTDKEGEPAMCIDSKGRIITKKGNIPLLKEMVNEDVFVMKADHYKKLQFELRFLRSLQSCA